MENEAARRWQVIRDYVFRRGTLVSLDLGLPDNIVDHILQLTAQDEFATFVVRRRVLDRWQMLRPGPMERFRAIDELTPDRFVMEFWDRLSLLNRPRFLPPTTSIALLVERRLLETAFRQAAPGEVRRRDDTGRSWRTRLILQNRYLWPPLYN